MAFSEQILKDFIENTIAFVQRTGLKVLELQSRYVKLIIQGFGDDRLIRITPGKQCHFLSNDKYACLIRKDEIGV
jgi:hypothetical protein